MTKQQRSTKRGPSYWEYVDALHFVQNSNSSFKRNASSSEQPIQRRTMPMLDQFHPCIHDSIVNIVDVKADSNCGYRAIAAILDRFEELKRFLLVDGLSMTTMDKWMNITDMGYVIASRYNVILVSLSL
ncbi:hypothetical protein GmHk_10G029298 [Glycine max]|nr:hypothetical protein GmHk_10G029298 [Glycine max]